MTRRKIRTRWPAAAEAAPAYGDAGAPAGPDAHPDGRHAAAEEESTRYNLIVPVALKRRIDRLAAARGISGPELARRLLRRGVQRIEERVIWKDARSRTPTMDRRREEVSRQFAGWAAAWDRLHGEDRRAAAGRHRRDR